MINQKVELRLKLLRLALEEINLAYTETLIDSFLEQGLKYEIGYEMTNQYNELHDNARRVKKDREEILYYRIFCLTQIIYSLKEYLRELYPLKKNKIEKFFSKKGNGKLARTDLANNLKHDPKNDLKFGLVINGKKTEKFNKSELTTYYFNWNWHLGGIDSIEYCKKLVLEIEKFIQEEI